jgi:predicted GTPase
LLSRIRTAPGTNQNIIRAKTNVRMADVFVINKVDTANPDSVIAGARQSVPHES